MMREHIRFIVPTPLLLSHMPLHTYRPCSRPRPPIHRRDKGHELDRMQFIIALNIAQWEEWKLVSGGLPAWKGGDICGGGGSRESAGWGVEHQQAWREGGPSDLGRELTPPPARPIVPCSALIPTVRP